MLRLTAEERGLLALRLGRQGIAAFAAAQGIDLATARRQLEQRRQAGRRPSRCMEEISGIVQ